MKATISDWMKQQAERKGLFAIGVIHPDNSFSGQSCSSIYPSIFLNNSWRCLKETFETVRELHQFDTLCLRWVYEHASLYAAQRMDRTVLGLYVSRDEQLVPRNDVEQILNDFLFLEDQANYRAA